MCISLNANIYNSKLIKFIKTIILMLFFIKIIHFHIDRFVAVVNASFSNQISLVEEFTETYLIFYVRQNSMGLFVSCSQNEISFTSYTVVLAINESITGFCSRKHCPRFYNYFKYVRRFFVSIIISGKYGYKCQLYIS